MSDNASPSTGKRKPPFIAYHVRDGKGDSKGHWVEAGVAFPHKDGKGFDVLLDVVPLAGRVTLRASE